MAGPVCWLGASLLVLSSVHFECDETSLSEGGRRLLAAGGTLLNLALGGLALIGFKAWRRGPHGRWFLWLLVTVNLFQAAGYFLFSGIGDIGDWGVVIGGLRPALAWRAALTLTGALAYVLVARAAAGWLAPLIGGEGRIAARVNLPSRAIGLGEYLYCTSSLFNPVGPSLLLISAAAASFGGASGLLWFHEWLRGDRIPLSSDSIVLDRRVGWLVAGALTAIVFIGLLGPGIRL